MLWLARRRYALNVEQIERDEIEDLAALDDDNPQTVRQVYDRHSSRRRTARFFVATREARRLKRLGQRWDVPIPVMVHRGEANEEAIGQLRRGIRDARWTFGERMTRTVIPILSLAVALVALLMR
ncbi:MAG TPA: hypothetical protein VG538_10805 [Vicinamibacterales bacterium]|nr:hypothetical protein [Vicinamibacterales bacterium]